LGRAQRSADADREALVAAGWDIVRRPTGGRAILHTDELTYSLALPIGDPLAAGTVVASYRRLSAGLARGLERLGLSARAAERQAARRSRAGGPVCFDGPSHYEITFQGKKLLGSAQARVKGAVLQHGSLPLRGDIGRICSVLAGRPDPDQVRARAVTLQEALGRAVSWDEAAEALAAGFGAEFGLSIEPGELTPEERERAARLETDKYAADKWTGLV
jgi:lipoate-protein ligase A